MTKGAYGQYLVKNQTIDSFMRYYEWVLYEYQYYPNERFWDGRAVRHKAIQGDKGQAFLLSHAVPFGSLMEEGNRYGAEIEVYQHGPDLFVRLLLMPYMSIFDERDIFLISQGIFEKMLDDERCRDRIGAIVTRLMQHGVEIYSY